jgi:hypothetical protein
VYRDLSKPVGALNEDRFEISQERYEGFDDPEIPPFFFGSHYSSDGIALYYLLRLEPYTSLAASLQGGRFDLADRLFDSIAGVWDLDLTTSMSRSRRGRAHFLCVFLPSFSLTVCSPSPFFRVVSVLLLVC